MADPLDDESGNHFRRKPRPGGRVAVRWRWLQSDGATSELHSGWTANLGLGGAFIETDAAHARGAQLTLEVELPPAERTVSLRAEVRWVAATGDEGEAGMGVHFLGVTEEVAAALVEYFGTLTDTVDHDEAQ